MVNSHHKRESLTLIVGGSTTISKRIRNMNTIDINVQTKVAQNRQLISQFGRNLGTQFYKIESREIWQGGKEGFEADRKAISDGTNKGFILNRSPKKFLLKSHEILCTSIYKDPITEEVGVAVNPDGKGGYDLFLPLNNDILKAGNVTVENVTAALRGEKQEFFLNPDAVVDLINRANQQEYDNLKALREKISKMEQNLLGVIAENKQKAEAANKEWMNSAVQTGLDDVLNHTAAGIIVSQKTEQA